MGKEIETTTDKYLVTWTVDPGEAGLRLDHFLKAKYRRLSREYLQKAIKNQRVTLNHQAAKPSRILRLNDKVYVLSVRGKEPEVDFNYKVLYEDDTIMVIDKPGNLPVHPTGRYFFHTLLTQLRVVNKIEVDQTKDFYITHRIDRETSGVLVVGKTSEAASDIVEQFLRRQTEKEYFAIVRGIAPEDRWSVSAPIAKDPQSGIKLKMCAVQLGKDGKPLFLPESEVASAHTDFEVVKRYARYTLVRCKPHTGRQHQIRVHLDHVGLPIAGDKLYGQSEQIFLDSIKMGIRLEVEPGIFLNRHALHAHRLAFKHPKTGKRLEFVSPLPQELEEFLEKIY